MLHSSLSATEIFVYVRENEEKWAAPMITAKKIKIKDREKTEYKQMKKELMKNKRGGERKKRF